MMKRALLFFLLPLLFVGCAMKAPIQVTYSIPTEREFPGREVQPDNSVIVPYASFAAVANEASTRASALNLFLSLVEPANPDEYVVKIQELKVGIKGKGAAVTTSYQFTLPASEGAFSKSSLMVQYIIDHEDIAVSKVDNHALTLAGFERMRSLEMFRKEPNDAIAAFITRDRGPEVDVVVRAVDGPNKITALVTFFEPTRNSRFLRSQMVTALKDLSEGEIFPTTIQNCRLAPELHDLELSLDATVYAREGEEPCCEVCRNTLQMAPFAWHGYLVTNKTKGKLLVDVYRPFEDKVALTGDFDIALESGTPFCLDSRMFYPGERVELIVKDTRGTLIKKFDLSPRPLLVKSEVDGGTIQAELISPEFYTLKGQGISGKINFKSISGEESFTRTYEEFRDFCIMYSPAVKGKRGGVGNLTFTRQSGEKLELSLPWGSAITNKGSA